MTDQDRIAQLLARGKEIGDELTRLLRALGAKVGRGMPRIGQVIGDFALDAKGRSDDE